MIIYNHQVRERGFEMRTYSITYRFDFDVASPGLVTEHDGHTYKYGKRTVTIEGYECLFDLLRQLYEEGFDMENPVDGNTVTDHDGIFATIS